MINSTFLILGIKALRATDGLFSQSPVAMPIFILWILAIIAELFNCDRLAAGFIFLSTMSMIAMVLAYT